eukprot:TRINITY_DN5047_c0_g3_i2.p3 TRINITY_DN5047_c0_g3~~TRINITY_DN5047_c0_g3_i2.p3  ORF type:complete len:149 (+),score=10.77 TRINITY_DN5047_c0_g3_i2:151-597(+)
MVRDTARISGGGGDSDVAVEVSDDEYIESNRRRRTRVSRQSASLPPSRSAEYRRALRRKQKAPIPEAFYQHSMARKHRVHAGDMVDTLERLAYQTTREQGAEGDGPLPEPYKFGDGISGCAFPCPGNAEVALQCIKQFRERVGPQQHR